MVPLDVEQAGSLDGGEDFGGVVKDEVQVDLSSWAGSELQVRWHAGEDEIIGHVGWYVDSVTLSNAGLGGACLSTPPPPLSFYTVTPCRLADTRNANGPLGGPALQAGAVRPFTLTGVSMALTGPTPRRAN